MPANSRWDLIQRLKGQVTDNGGWPTPRTELFIPGKDAVFVVEEAGWAPGLSGRARKISLLP